MKLKKYRNISWLMVCFSVLSFGMIFYTDINKLFLVGLIAVLSIIGGVFGVLAKHFLAISYNILTFGLVLIGVFFFLMVYARAGYS